MNVGKASNRPRHVVIALVVSIGVAAVGCSRGTGSGPHLTAPSSSETPSTATTTTIAVSPSASPTSPPSSATGVALTSVSWSSVHYGGTYFPNDCSPDVRQVKYVTPAPTVTDAAVVVSCQSGAGTPPSALLLFDKADSSGTPHMLQSLISYYDALLFSSSSADGPSLSVIVSGYHVSSAQPSSFFHATLGWEWKDGDYRLQTTVPSHEPVCGAPACTPITTLGQATLPVT